LAVDFAHAHFHHCCNFLNYFHQSECGQQEDARLEKLVECLRLVPVANRECDMIWLGEK